MKIIQPLFYVLLTLCLSSCKTVKEKEGNSRKATLKIALARGSCKGKCPVYHYNIFSNGTVNYQGDRNIEPLGTKTVLLKKQELNQIMSMSELVDFEQLKNEYVSNIRDLPVMEVNFDTGTSVKKIRYQNRKAPKELVNWAAKMDSIVFKILRVKSP